MRNARRKRMGQIDEAPGVQGRVRGIEIGSGRRGESGSCRKGSPGNQEERRKRMSRKSPSVQKW
jgi:hypothetical protein